MRLVTYDFEGDRRAGIAIEDKVVDAASAARSTRIRSEGGAAGITNRGILQMTPVEQAGLEQVARELANSSPSDEVYLMEGLRLGPPIPDPEKIICLGLNYRSHAEEIGFKLPEYPILFAKYRNALGGPASPIILPDLSEEIDYEGELGVVIGKRCKHVPAEKALEYVAGYMALNDISARDLQFRSGQWLSGKALDTFAPCGPALVIGEISDPQNLDISTILNGQVMQQGNTRNMIFSVADSIAYISQLMTLEPGDIISTGTPEGVGFQRKPPIFLRDGDTVEVSIEKIGSLKNPVVGQR
jgi:2-keto-4-pentenoate hydratase/2-oxohepta-3-ene-1,7-dioic acid hydratase in catechol pathway